LILAPVQNSTSHTLRERTLRNRIPFLAESCPQDGAIYLGPDNYEAAFVLGQWTGANFQENRGQDRPGFVLDITQDRFPNTLERSKGFKDGIQSVMGDRFHSVSIDGGGLYSNVYQVATDALGLHPEINILFGINDDSVLAGIQAYLDLNRDPAQLIAVNVGVEGNTVLKVLTGDSPLKACIGLFPDVVARLAIGAIVNLWNGRDIGDAVMTPYALLTADNLSHYYHETQDGWVFIHEQSDSLNWRASPLKPLRSTSVSIAWTSSRVMMSADGLIDR
jgi:ABC-type sugar transport system substrate-binding protein